MERKTQFEQISRMASMYGWQWNELQAMYPDSTFQQMINEVMKEFFKEYDDDVFPQRAQMLRKRSERGVRREMGRKSIADDARRKTRHCGLTDSELQQVQGGFKKLRTSVLFLSDLMIECYKDGLIPDEKVNFFMEKWKDCEGEYDKE